MNTAIWLQEHAPFSAIDRQFGRFCARHTAPADRSMLGFFAALVSHARNQGHSCLALEEIAGNPWQLGESETSEPLIIPPLADCLEFLARQTIVGNGGQLTPLVLEQNRLYLYRYWEAEQILAQFILKQQNEALPREIPASFKESFAVLFGPFPQEPNWQAVAAFAATQGSFTLITGGPGTGKTTTVVRMLAAVLLDKPHLRVAISAPTGKAVARLSESIRNQAEHLPDQMALHFPTDVQTLHRLLAYQPHTDRFGYHAKRHLPFDLIVVDEASMVDILLMANLIQAMAPTCQLILLGDHQQLASVDAGNILADLCQVADPTQPHSTSFSKAYAELTQQTIPSAIDAPALRDRLVLLKHSHRFNEHAGLGALSQAVRIGASDRAIALLQDPTQEDVQLLGLPRNNQDLLVHLQPYLDAYLSTTQLADAFQAYQQLRLLTALREGPLGVTGLNTLIEQHLRRQGIQFKGNHYPYRPILVTRNDYGQQLFNGDIGICWHDSNQRLHAYFPQQDGGFRAVALLKLPSVESAWALTVHKSQGSEFEEVCLILPPEEHPLCKRELIYTGLTRARWKATLFGSTGQVAYGITHSTTRFSGLASLLQ